MFRVLYKDPSDSSLCFGFKSLFCILRWSSWQSLRWGIHLWHPQKMTIFLPPTIPFSRRYNWSIVQKQKNLQARAKLPTYLLCSCHKWMSPYSDHSFFICFVTDHFCIYFLKLIVNSHRWSQARHIWSYNHTTLVLPTNHINDCVKVILHDLFR